MFIYPAALGGAGTNNPGRLCAQSRHTKPPPAPRWRGLSSAELGLGRGESWKIPEQRQARWAGQPSAREAIADRARRRERGVRGGAAPPGTNGRRTRRAEAHARRRGPAAAPGPLRRVAPPRPRRAPGGEAPQPPPNGAFCGAEWAEGRARPPAPGRSPGNALPPGRGEARRGDGSPAQPRLTGGAGHASAGGRSPGARWLWEAAAARGRASPDPSRPESPDAEPRGCSVPLTLPLPPPRQVTASHCPSPPPPIRPRPRTRRRGGGRGARASPPAAPRPGRPGGSAAPSPQTRPSRPKGRERARVIGPPRSRDTHASRHLLD